MKIRAAISYRLLPSSESIKLHFEIIGGPSVGIRFLQNHEADLASLKKMKLTFGINKVYM